MNRLKIENHNLSARVHGDLIDEGYYYSLDVMIFFSLFTCCMCIGASEFFIHYSCHVTLPYLLLINISLTRNVTDIM